MARRSAAIKLQPIRGRDHGAGAHDRADPPRRWPPSGQAPPPEPGLSFAEGFEDTKLTRRGWYDGDRFTLSDDAVAGATRSSITLQRQADPDRLIRRPAPPRADRGRLPPRST